VGTAVSSVVESGVRTAYAVIDEYMRRGQDAARAIFNESDTGGFMNNYRQNCSGGNAYGSGFTPWNPMAMIAEPWISAMCAWSQMWCSMVPGFRQPAMNPCTSTEDRPEPVNVIVVSKGAVEASWTICPGTDLNCIETEDLLAQGIAANPIPAARVQYRAQGKPALRVEVPDGQAKGTYRGIIRRKSDRYIVGEVTVEVK